MDFLKQKHQLDHDLEVEQVVLLLASNLYFDEIEKLQHLGAWDETAKILGEAAKNIQNASADFLVICTNTMHKVAPLIQTYIDIPILHIADASGKKLQNENIKRGR